MIPLGETVEIRGELWTALVAEANMGLAHGVDPRRKGGGFMRLTQIHAGRTQTKYEGKP